MLSTAGSFVVLLFTLLFLDGLWLYLLLTLILPLGLFVQIGDWVLLVSYCSFRNVQPNSKCPPRVSVRVPMSDVTGTYLIRACTVVTKHKIRHSERCCKGRKQVIVLFIQDTLDLYLSLSRLAGSDNTRHIIL
uniref:Uncharacterized protein n=1 Tax=Cacopsylla melanoneura TaxID=428564 RepID=A0A8D8Q1S6_9HEMI